MTRIVLALLVALTLVGCAHVKHAADECPTYDCWE